jgi:hypothetical protein
MLSFVTDHAIEEKPETYFSRGLGIKGLGYRTSILRLRQDPSIDK